MLLRKLQSIILAALIVQHVHRAILDLHLSYHLVRSHIDQLDFQVLILLVTDLQDRYYDHWRIRDDL